MKVSIRFGLRLGWPFVNAATFVTKINKDQFLKFEDAVTTIRQILHMSGSSDVADRIIFEERR
jgi:hypothetical protein